MLDLNALFDESFYLKNNQDVAQAVASNLLPSGLDHFQRFGQFEGRNPSALFDTSLYLTRYPDVAASVTAGLLTSVQHFLNFGQVEGRDPSIFFDTGYYLDLYSDVEAAVEENQTTAFQHFVEFGQREGRDPFLEFNTLFYLQQNPDVLAAVVRDELTGIEHFVKYGQLEGRNPSPEFNTRLYLQRNPDVAQAVQAGRISAIKHYIQFGLPEERLGSPTSPLDLSEARNLGSLNSLQTISSFVGDFKPQEIYSFTLTQPAQLSMNLQALSADADLVLIQDKNNNTLADENEILSFSENEGTAPEAINALLNAGTYFVRVAQFEGNTNYDLRLSALPKPLPFDGAGNTLGTARNFGTLSGSLTANDFVGAVDIDDYYQFTVNTRSDLKLTLDGLSADADLVLIQDLNGNGIVDDIAGLVDDSELLNVSENEANQSETIEVQGLKPGSYFVQVNQYNGDTNYKLNLSALPSRLPLLPNLSGASFNVVPDSLSAGNSFEVEYRIKNTEEIPAGAFTVGFYLSPAPEITAQDLLLGTATINGLAGNSTSGVLKTNLTLPAVGNEFWLGDENYYIGMVVDSNATVSETVEDDNLATNLLQDFDELTVSNTGVQSAGISLQGVAIAPDVGISALTGQTAPPENDSDRSIRTTSSNSVTNLRVFDASGDSTPNTVLQGGAVRLNYNFANIGAVSNVRLEISRGGAPTITNLGTQAVLTNYLVNTTQFTSGDYSFRVVATTTNSQEFSTAAQTITILPVNRIDGDFTAQTFNYAGEGGTATVVLGRGGTDTLNLSGISRNNVTSFNGGRLGEDRQKAIFGGTAWDFITLADGREIYFQGIESLRFADGTQSLSIKPNDGLYWNQWNAFISDVPSAWRFTQGAKNILLVSIDSGVPVNREGFGIFDLGRLLNTNEPAANDPNDSDVGGHGHQAISAMAAIANNNSGTAGINWNSDVIVQNPYRGGINLLEAIQNSINYARNNGYQRVVFQGGIQGKFWLTGRNEYTPNELENLIRENSDIAFFAIAAGNGGPQGNLEDPDYLNSVSGVATFETNLRNVMSVGALRPGEETNTWYGANGQGIAVTNGLKNATDVSLASYSNRGQNLTLVAATDSPVTAKNNQGKYFGGTSCANPNMAGIASLVWSVNPQLSGGELRQVLIDTAMDLGDAGRDNTFGFGLVNADAAVRRAFALERDPRLARLYSGGSLLI